MSALSRRLPTHRLLARLLLALPFASQALANPFPDPGAVPLDPPDLSLGDEPLPDVDADTLRASADQVLRVQVRWSSTRDDFTIEALERERSGTAALLAASRRLDPHGSFKARLIDPASGRSLSYATIGTGAGYKYLVRALTFRFPLPTSPVRFELTAENGDTGAMEVVLRQTLNPVDFRQAPVTPDLEVRTLRAATSSPSIIVNVYAEGYMAAARERFFQEARRVPAALADGDFPMLEHFEIRAVFAPSNQALGSPRDLGLPVPERDSHLGLYFPYWHDFGRYEHVVYPTRELRYRRAIGSVPYDYPIALIDDDAYWGVGNFKELTAVPSRHNSFGFLLRHEIGHYFGLNEEYEEGGATELAFAPHIPEPWSQNITFQSTRAAIKWRQHIAASTPVPTPASSWSAGRYGAYEGGYGNTPKPGAVSKPGFACVMRNAGGYCPICAEALADRVRRDLGL